MATKKNETTAETATGTAITKPDAAGLALHDPLAGLLGDGFEITETGTEALAGSARIPRYAFNLTTVTGDDGKPREVRKTVFVQTVTGVEKAKLRLQVIVDHKSRQWKEQIDGKGVVRCSSWDGVTGSYGEERTERACNGCPDYRWGKDDKGKNRRKCGDVHNIVALDLDTLEVVIVAAKKTAIRPWTDFYAKHFQKQRGVRDPKTGLLKRVDLPFFARETLVELKLVTRNAESWAEPVFVAGPMVETRELLQQGLQALSDWKEHQAAIAARGDAIEATVVEHDGEGGGGGGGAGDASFDFGANTGTDGLR